MENEDTLRNSARIPLSVRRVLKGYILPVMSIILYTPNGLTNQKFRSFMMSA
jgi:hypothetical protein